MQFNHDSLKQIAQEDHSFLKVPNRLWTEKEVPPHLLSIYQQELQSFLQALETESKQHASLPESSVQDILQLLHST